ncbi:MAG: formylmethanofuran dehydrogenase subunit C [Candidatus Heimdallarchaeota archaeon]|nr:formylmethanofuran dehydrogenase subunit C [Candidatus Heimdallarchaeota archaeon]
MSKVILTRKQPDKKSFIPIEAENIVPDIFSNKTLTEIKQLPLWLGNEEIFLKEIFEVKGVEKLIDEISEIEIEIIGNCSKIKRIGEKMTGGKMIINGSVGMHLGNQMEGGTIMVEGEVDDFAGANMKGGKIIINGNAGHYLGGSARGDWRGMTGGKIIVKGDVGKECGIWMRKGSIEIHGNADAFLGMHLHQGVIIVNGDVEERVGAEMTGGIIIIRGTLKKNLPSFIFEDKKEFLEINGLGKINGPFLKFKGDFAERKQGTLYVLERKNKHLIV